MRTTIRLLHRVFATLLTFVLLVVHIRLYLPSVDEYTHDHTGADVVPQLRFIGASLRGGSGTEMQALFPEGFFFSHVLYGLAWVEVAMRTEAGAPLFRQALDEANWALEQLESPQGYEAFSPNLTPPYGVFYIGWSNWLRGGIVRMQPEGERDPAQLQRFIDDCAALAAAFDESSTPFLRAYPSQAWPVDNVVAMAALQLHDTLLPARHQATIERWLAAARERLDPATGLLPHSVDPETGFGLEGARGSSQSIIARFLPEIDPLWGHEQYLRFREEFVTTVIGVPGVREYPHGIEREGDVDSGPLIFGISLSATVVTLGAAFADGDRVLAEPLLHAGEALGMAVEWNGARRYGFGVLPVGDAFLAWSKTARPWLAARVSDAAFVPVTAWWWRLPLHVGAIALLALAWLPVFRIKRV